MTRRQDTHAVPGEEAAPCRDRCGTYRDGHDLHAIQAKLIGQTPWGWRDAVLMSVDGQTIELAYVHEHARPTLWHHRVLGRLLRPGEPVRLHEQYRALGTPHGWYSVRISNGLGAVPEPEDRDAYATRTCWGAVDLATGVAIALDHVSFDQATAV